MLHKTRGIVLKSTDYGETSVVVQVFTEKFGLQSYLLNGVKKPRAKITRNMLQPLHLLDMVVYHKPAGSLQRVAELRNMPLLQSIPYDILKSSIAIFLNEVIYKAVRQQSADENLFQYLFSAVEWLDQQEESLVNFHLVFLCGLTRYLGFYPEQTPIQGAGFFDMQNGAFTRDRPEGPYYLSPPHTRQLSELLQISFANQQALRISNDERRYLLQKLLDYFALHLEGFGDIRSRQVLEDVFG